jgi:crossover junction endodeoxyribonuclease RuvC
MNGRAVTEKIILGIDPGTNVMGFGIIKITGTNMSLQSPGVLDISHLDDHPIKLRKIFERTISLIEEFKPDELAIEAPFFGKNVQSMLKLGRAQGVAMAAGLVRDLPIFEYSPKKIKQSITGNGNASKEQVAAMIGNLLKIKDLPKELDATDGLAAAVCHHFQFKAVGVPGKSFTGWKAFLKANPDKLK